MLELSTRPLEVLARTINDQEVPPHWVLHPWFCDNEGLHREELREDKPPSELAHIDDAILKCLSETVTDQLTRCSDLVTLSPVYTVACSGCIKTSSKVVHPGKVLFAAGPEARACLQFAYVYSAWNDLPDEGEFATFPFLTLCGLGRALSLTRLHR
ncbi:hypothetical protein FVE85_0205 [Porphyridium purpureum]|uniref:Uncharacterized protein n=1 Tax=Porphyridium purpureum TaxID=35688 RepID=A0A5J4YYU1_PORPP|nr:hypothetical protein FVE85_0205 [Porphyridium purpureum]|eukprot:POR4047..scf208_2